LTPDLVDNQNKVVRASAMDVELGPLGEPKY